MANPQIASAHLANLLIPFCEAASINCRNADAALIKRILVSFSFIDTEQLYDVLFPGQPIDWPNVREYLHNVQYTTKDWISLVAHLMDFVQEENPTPQVIELVSSTLAGMRVSIQGKTLSPLDTLRICFAKGGVSPSWDTLCKTFVLLHITDIDNEQVLNQILLQQQQKQQQSSASSSASSAAAANTAEIIKQIATVFRHKPEEYTVILANLLQVNEGCRIKSHYIIQSLKIREDLLEKKKMDNQLIFAQNQKPSLTKILEMKQQQQLQQHNNSAAGNLASVNFDSFVSFCDVCRLPSNSSLKLKRVIYFFKCLNPTLPTSSQESVSVFLLTKIIGNDPVLFERIQNTTVVTPDLPTLKQFLDETYYTMGLPFTALKHFHQTFIVASNSLLNWSLVFRLYLCIYCRPEIVKEMWTDAWKRSKDHKQQPNKSDFTQNYVTEHPFAVQEVVQALLASMQEESPQV